MRFPEIYGMELVRPEADDAIVEAKVQGLLRAMTLEEKYSFLCGNGLGEQANAGDLPGVPRLGVPQMLMYDGPGGVYFMTETTNPPQEQMLAATWDEAMAELWGKIYAVESRAIGNGMMLSAQLDIQRNPHFNRTKDQMGADPCLLSRLADDMTRGMQSEGGIAVLKHFVAYTEDMNNDVVSEQALHEIYMPGFESAVRAGALGIMSSYNQINGVYASANRYTQNDVLRGMWNYKYFTITDWGGNHEFTLDKGTDIEMPFPMGNALPRLQARAVLGKERSANPRPAPQGGFGFVQDQWDALESLTPEEADALVNRAAGRVLGAYGKAGYLTLVELDGQGIAREEPGRTALIRQPDRDTAQRQLADVKDFANRAAQTVAENGAVLLKNEAGALPLNEGDAVAVIGLTGMRLASGFGGERSYGTVSEMVGPCQALKDILGEDRVTGAVYRDIVGTTIPNACLYTSAEGDAHGVVRTYGTTGAVAGVTAQQGQVFPTGNVPKRAMSGHAIGEPASIDPALDYHAGTIGGRPNQTYLIENADAGTATGFAWRDDPAYTFDTWIQAPEDGEYLISFNNMGAIAKLAMYDTDGRTVIAELDNPSNRQNSQWYVSIVPDDYGRDVETARVTLAAGRRYHVTLQIVSAVDSKDVQLNLSWTTPAMRMQQREAALEAARRCGKVVIFAYRTTETCAFRHRLDATLRLPPDQEEMIIDVARVAHAAGNRVIVVLNNDAPVVMSPWIDSADAILDMYYPGQRGGQATARLLTGAVNPSGKLAFTIPKSDADTIITCSDEAFALYQAPADAKTGVKTTIYAEGVNTDYRWFLHKGIQPEFAFGHGLSYTRFEYSDLTVTPAPAQGDSVGFDVAFSVTNTGEVAGSEVAQLYLGRAEVPDGLQSPPLQLVDFCKVKDLRPGERREVRLHVSERALSFWNTPLSALNTRPDGTRDKWTVAKGGRTLYVGGASDQAALTGEVEIS